MTHFISPETLPAPEFTPVVLARRRHDGWSPECQRRFIAALATMGTVGRAAKAVGKGRASAYALRDAPGAESFAAAWDQALQWGRGHAYDVAMETALNGVTTITIARGGSVTIGQRPDMPMINAVMREPPPAHAHA